MNCIVGTFTVKCYCSALTQKSYFRVQLSFKYVRLEIAFNITIRSTNERKIVYYSDVARTKWNAASSRTKSLFNYDHCFSTPTSDTTISSVEA